MASKIIINKKSSKSKRSSTKSNKSDKEHKKNSSSFIQKLRGLGRKKQSSIKQQRSINDWVLGETLGMGGYSKVKLGVHKKTNTKAALKIMFADQNGVISPSKKRQLVRELKVMKKVKHKNVVQLIEYDEDASYPESNGSKTACILVVLEFAPGGELFDYLMFTGRFDEIATRTYFHQLMDGLGAIHKAGIAHRDLKPENLLLDSQHNLKIADFGFATEFITEDGLAKKLTTACGTKGYLAPELLKGKKYGHKCDIFACGIIMFTTFAGFPPFQNAVDTDWWWDKLSKGWKYLEQGKRMQKESDIQKHKAAGLAKKALFWKAHERSVKFPADFKYLIEYTLHPLPSQRYDIPNIRKDSWFKGKTYSQSQLAQFLKKRVHTVGQQRVEKIKKQLQEQGGDTSDEYSTKPVIGGKLLPMQKRAKELDPKNEFVKYMDSVQDDMFVKCLYAFNTKCVPAEMAARVERVADRISAKCTISPSNNITVVRCQINFQDDNNEDDSFDEDVIFAVKQFLIDDENDDDDNSDNNSDDDDADDTKDDDNDKNDKTKDDDNDDNDNDDDDDSDDTSNKDDKVSFDYNKKYRVAFKRLKGSHLAYKKAVEDFYYAKEVCQAMELNDMKLMTMMINKQYMDKTNHN